MITIISGTNRRNSNTLTISTLLRDRLIALGEQVELLDLSDIGQDVLTEAMYFENGQAPWVTAVQNQYLIPSQHWVVVSPEYNGSFSGVLKLFIDAVSVRKYKETFAGKKVSLVGVASGRAGNLRGLDHLTGIFNYLKMLVMPVKLPVSSVEKLITKDKVVSDALLETINQYALEIQEFSAWHKRQPVGA
jgi:chromate reductase